MSRHKRTCFCRVNTAMANNSFLGKERYNLIHGRENRVARNPLTVHPEEASSHASCATESTEMRKYTTGIKPSSLEGEAMRGFPRGAMAEGLPGTGSSLGSLSALRAAAPSRAGLAWPVCSLPDGAQHRSGPWVPGIKHHPFQGPHVCLFPIVSPVIHFLVQQM